MLPKAGGQVHFGRVLACPDRIISAAAHQRCQSQSLAIRFESFKSHRNRAKGSDFLSAFMTIFFEPGLDFRMKRPTEPSQFMTLFNHSNHAVKPFFFILDLCVTMAYQIKTVRLPLKQSLPFRKDVPRCMLLDSGKDPGNKPAVDLNIPLAVFLQNDSRILVFYLRYADTPGIGLQNIRTRMAFPDHPFKRDKNPLTGRR